MTDSARILVVDNYDSFVYTIVGYLKTLGATVTVVRNDAIDPSEDGVIDEYDGVLISPGPGAPGGIRCQRRHYPPMRGAVQAHVRRLLGHAGTGRKCSAPP